MRREDMRIYARLSKHAVVLSYCTRLLGLDYSYDLFATGASRPVSDEGKGIRVMDHIIHTTC